MFIRNAAKYLDAWKESADRKPLVLRGARQVGKTTLVNDFANKFDVYLSLNLERKRDFLLFNETDDTQQLLDNIYLHCKQNKKPGKVLLFIDEIQNSSSAVSMLRYFYEDTPELYVIAAGSLLESLIDKTISFPVGRVEYLAVRPFSFVEFLNAIGENFDSDLVENVQAEAVHERVLNFFYKFCLVGGMPAAIVNYSDNRDILAIDKIYESLIASYIDDVQKYARNDTIATVIAYVIKNGLSHAASRVTFERFNNSNYKSREVSEAFRTLEKAMLLELVYPTGSSQLPFHTSASKRPKLIWLDVGLVNYFAGIREELFSVSSITNSWRGKIAEQVVAQELISDKWKVLTKRAFWERNALNSIAELDFIYSYKGYLIPIEVKSGHNSRLKSLHYYMDSTSHDIAVRVWSNKLSIDRIKTLSGKEFTLINLPFYYVCVIDKVLDKYI